MSVHEYVSMSLLRDAGVPTPKFGLATTAAEAKQIAEDLDTKDLVIKAQVRKCYILLLIKQARRRNKEWLEDA